MNHTIIHDRAGLINFTLRFMPLLVWEWIIRFSIRPYVDGLSVSASLLFDAGASLVDHCYFCGVSLVFVASSMASKNSPAALPVFLLYSVLNGFTLSFVVAFYTSGTVLSAFVSSALLFFVMAAVGMFTKKDLSGIGRAMMAALSV